MKPFSGDELISAIRRVYQMRPAHVPATPAARGRGAQATAIVEKGQVQQGRIISVYSPRGSGCDNCVNLASPWPKRMNTILVDGSLQFGDVAVMLNIRPSTTIVDLMDRMEDLEQDLVSSVTVSHRSGLHVLMAPPRPEMADLVTEANVKRLLEHLREHYDFVIIDTSSSLNDVALAMLDMSDRIFLVTQQSLPALKNASRFFDLAETLDYSRDKVLLLVNRSSERLGISVKDIASTLKRPVIATLPIDDEAVNRAIDEGKPLITGRHRRRPISTALYNLAEVTMTLFDQEGSAVGGAASAPGVPFWKRLLGRSPEAAG